MHNDAISWHSFGTAERPIEAMTAEPCCFWLDVCRKAEYLPLHISEPDFVLWWYRRNTGRPAAPLTAKTA